MGPVEGELERRLDVRVSQVNALQGAVRKVATHPLDEAPGTAPHPRRAASEGKQVTDDPRGAPRDSQMRNVRNRAAALLYLFLKKAPLTLSRRQLRADLRNVSRILP